MCGIAVAIDWDGAGEIVRQLVEGLQHRGDITDPIATPKPLTAMATRRLRIVDGQHAVQPQSSWDGRVLVSFNGEIYNHAALLADAGHNMSDALGLGVAWGAVILAKRRPTPRFTYGLGGTSILAALFNAVFLLVVVGGLSWEAIQRFSQPAPVAGKTVMAVAACGIVLNGLCAWLFSSGSKGDLNVRGAFMHMAADALVSLGVVASGFVILLTGWHWLDPAASLVINAVIIWGTWSLLTGSLAMCLNAVPAGIETAKVEAYLSGLRGVTEVHDLHIWSMSTTEAALTVHLVRPSGLDDDFLANAAHELAHRFNIKHATIQTETGARECKLAPVHVV